MLGGTDAVQVHWVNYFKVQIGTFLVVDWKWRFPKSVSIDRKYVRVQIKVLHRFWRNTMHLVFHDSSFFFLILKITLIIQLHH